MLNTKSIQDNLNRAESFRKQGREIECERLLVTVLREAPEGSQEHWLGLVLMGELYESQNRIAEARIVCRSLPKILESQSVVGQRGQRLWKRIKE